MTPAERVGNNLNGFTDFRIQNGSRQGQNLALTGFHVFQVLSTAGLCLPTGHKQALSFLNPSSKPFEGLGFGCCGAQG